MTQEEKATGALNEAHRLLALLRIGMDEYNPISELLIEAKAQIAERSRLLEEAGMPTDEEKKEVNDAARDYTEKEIATADHRARRHLAFVAGANWMRSRCAALLLKEREGLIQTLNAFDSWMRDELFFFRKKQGPQDFIGVEGWYTAKRLCENRGPFTMSQLYAIFDSQRKKGDSERKVD